MSDGYAKLFSDIVDSSIWLEDAETCKVWVTLLALSDANGFVRGSVGWLASKSKVSVDRCQQALTKFCQPDPQSRTPDNQGRRIEEVERGWLILNYLYFRNEHKQLSNDPRRAYQREWMRKKRLSTKLSTESTSVNTASASASASASYQSVLGECEGGKPSGIPATEQEAIEWAGMRGVPQKEAADYFNQLSGRNWKDGAGVPVTNFQAYAASRYSRGKEVKRPQSNGPADHRAEKAAREYPEPNLKPKIIKVS